MSPAKVCTRPSPQSTLQPVTLSLSPGSVCVQARLKGEPSWAELAAVTLIVGATSATLIVPVVVVTLPSLSVTRKAMLRGPES
jgi:hypothetical protein